MKIKLLESKSLVDFPAGSSIEYFDEKVYITGQDARDILIMNKRWKGLSRISLKTDSAVSKAVKPDLQASTLIEVNSIPRLLLLGSGQEPLFRNEAVLLNLDDETREEFDTKPFYTRIKESGLTALNIRSATIILGELIIGNRGKSNADNRAIITSLYFWKDETKAPLSILKFDLPASANKAIGLSGMSYAPENDWLVLTFVTEGTGISYLGIVENATHKMTRKKIKVDELIDLAEADEKFKGNTVESVCVQSEKTDQVKIHLLANNKSGAAQLFKVRVKVS
jgi:Family of unknown function (DUF6929)